MWIDDVILSQCEKPCALDVWIPKEAIVVLGSGNKEDLECWPKACREDGVSILRRYGGGGSVVLQPSNVILSLGTWVSSPYRNDFYFKKINQALIDCLVERWPDLRGLRQSGISDLSILERKIAGTSMYRSRNYLLYQVSILVEDSLELIEKYLPHPSKEPDYRQKKSHRDFLGCLSAFSKEISPARVKNCLQKGFEERLFRGLASEFIEPVEKQIPHLLDRAQSRKNQLGLHFETALNCVEQGH